MTSTTNTKPAPKKARKLTAKQLANIERMKAAGIYDYWMQSAGQSVMNAYESGNYVEITATEAK